MLSDVRDFTRPSTPQKELKDINFCIEDTLAFMQLDLHNKGIKCVKLLEKKLPSLWFDPKQIKQVFINLFKNAEEAMPEGGNISISSWQIDGSVNVAISDTGHGISVEYIKRIFEPFYTNKKKGTGLGLAITRKILEDHGGSISVESIEGQGSTFIISLPLKPS
jgi:signal transduction histidine kinase